MGLLGTALLAVQAIPGQAPSAPPAAPPAPPPPPSRTAGVHVALTRDLAPVPAKGLPGGHLLEARAVLDEEHELNAASKILLRLIEDDPFSDDVVMTHVGTGATAPADGAQVACTTVVQPVPEGRDVAWVVEEHKRTRADYEATILVVTERPGASPGAIASRRRTHVVGWLRPWHQDDAGDVSEFRAQLDVEDGGAFGTSPIVEVGPLATGTAVRLTGRLSDADSALPAPLVDGLPDVPVTLGGRRSVTGEQGTFVIDARLAVGTHTLRIARSGVVGKDLTVTVTAAPAGQTPAYAVRVSDGATELAASPAPAAPAAGAPAPSAEAARGLVPVALDLGAPVALHVHKLRGTVLWPDSRRVEPEFRRTPLALRTVYALPLPDHADIAPHRPTTTAGWAALKRRPGVLRSARIDRAGQRERTAADGRFEIRYFDLSPGKRYLLWVERAAGDGTGPNAGTATDVPESVVRFEELELRRLNRADLLLGGRADLHENDPRRVVDPEYNLLSDPVRRGVDVVRIEEYGPGVGRSLIRPKRATRETFDAASVAPVAAAPGRPAVPGTPPPSLADVLATPVTAPAAVPGPVLPGAPANPLRVADGVDLYVLPIVPLDESAGAAAPAVRDAAAALDTTARAMFPEGHDRRAVRLALDARDLGRWVDLAPADAAAAGWTADEPNAPSRLVALLEQTFVFRHDAQIAQLLRTGPGRRTAWHYDALSVADLAYVRIGADETIRSRTIAGHAVVPLVHPVAPRLPAAAAALGVYLSPGHGLFPTTPASGALNHWESDRGGWSLRAGEDENDPMMARAAMLLLRAAGATVHFPRVLDDLDTAGVTNPVNGSFVVSADANFPRLWQQNPVYGYGATATAALLNRPAWAAAWGNPAGDKNDHGFLTRTQHIRALARAGSISIVLAIHTNAFNGGRRGPLTEYLEVDQLADRTQDGNAGSTAFAGRVQAQLIDRCGVATQAAVPAAGRPPRGVLSIQEQGSAIHEMINTVDHWACNISAADVQAIRLSPGGGAPPTRAQAGVAAAAPMFVPHDKPFPWDDRAAGHDAQALPVALTEVGYHDNASDAALLGRQWFRLRAGEAFALAIDEQLAASDEPVSRRSVRAALASVFGGSPVIDALLPEPAGANPPPPTGAQLLAAIHAVAGAEPPPTPPTPPAAEAPPAATIAGVIAAARTHAARLTREGLVEQLATAVRTRAGWQTGDQAATISDWVTAPIAGGALDRPGDPPTRREAGELAARAAALLSPNGIGAGGLDLAESLAVGAPARALIAPSTGSPDALFPPAAATALVAQLATVPFRELHRVARARLVDGGWNELPRGVGGYVVHAGTPVSLRLDTVGVPWKTVGQNVFANLADVEIRVTRGTVTRTLGCVRREPARVVSRLWLVDLPSTAAPEDVMIELRLRHRTEGWTSAGSVTVPLHVLPTPPAVAAP